MPVQDYKDRKKGKGKMALTREFKDTVQARAQRDPTFRIAMLAEGVDALLAGDVGTGKAVLRDYIKATVGFEKLAVATGTAQPERQSKRQEPLRGARRIAASVWGAASSSRCAGWTNPVTTLR